MRTFILLSAMPGAGKSTWAKHYVSTHPEAIIVSSDEIRVKKFGSASVVSHDDLVWPEFQRELEEGLKEDGKTVIADSTNLSNKYRIQYARSMASFADRKILIYFSVSYETCCRRNQMRAADRVVPAEAMERLKAEWEPLSDETMDAYDEVIQIDEDLKEKKLK